MGVESQKSVGGGVGVEVLDVGRGEIVVSPDRQEPYVAGIILRKVVATHRIQNPTSHGGWRVCSLDVVGVKLTGGHRLRPAHYVIDPRRHVAEFGIRAPWGKVLNPRAAGEEKPPGRGPLVADDALPS